MNQGSAKEASRQIEQAYWSPYEVIGNSARFNPRCYHCEHRRSDGHRWNCPVVQRGARA